MLLCYMKAAIIIFGVVLFLAACGEGNAVSQKKVIQQNMKSNTSNLQTVTLGAGCFWCVEAIFERIDGVISATSGYSGGNVINPSYKEVCTGRTGHAEVVQVVFDPAVLPFAKLLEIFFMTHDPTTLNRQGADVGTQYRSAIFYHNEEQKRIAGEIKALLDKEKIWNDPIVTEITPFKNFFIAEDYHQEYFENNPNEGYCRMVVAPKVAKFEKLFQDYLKK
jgi:peptide-methionine (S)-S-oxide reductase